MSSFIPNQRGTTFKILERAVMMLGKQNTKRKKTKNKCLCVLGTFTANNQMMLLMGSTKLGSVPACDSSRKSGSNSEPGEEVEQMDKLVNRQAGGSSE